MLVSRSSFQALYTYVPQNEDELELQEGDLVSVMEKCDDGWFVGMCRGINSWQMQSHLHIFFNNKYYVHAQGSGIELIFTVSHEFLLRFYNRLIRRTSFLSCSECICRISGYFCTQSHFSLLSEKENLLSFLFFFFLSPQEPQRGQNILELSPGITWRRLTCKDI